MNGHKYAIWTDGDDFTGWIEDTIEDCMKAIYSRFWWVGDEWICDNQTGDCIIIVHHTDVTYAKAYTKKMMEEINRKDWEYNNGKN